ncbi:MAG TPA: MASE2 domain-containing protein, partial [Luteimonas sp.]|nr:MASE2 domain-containing protein [Luteimonas sp.]
MLDLSAGRQPGHRARAFLLRIWQLRTLGAILASLPIFALLHEQRSPPWMTAALVIYALGWPPLAWRMSRRSDQPRV